MKRPTDPDQLDLAVRRAVATVLTDKQREAVELFFFEGLSQSEIARRCGVSQQVIQKRIYGVPRGGVVVGGALSKLREALSSVAA
jgi:DNA-directed RNA polymerase specialized sigma24 family protein